jgi:hypothetical protein
MKNDTDDLLTRMLKASHDRPSDAAESLPLGFANRVAARWATQGRVESDLSLWERWCGRVAVASATAALLAGWLTWQTWTPLQYDEEAEVVQQLTEQAFLP